MKVQSLLAALAILAPACGPSTAPVSSTTTGHKRPDYAPPAPDHGAKDSTGETPIPEPDDPEHERVVFVRAGSIFIMNAKGGDDRRLTVRAQSAPDETPALSPHGDAIAYASKRDGVSKIYVLALDGSGGTRAVTDGADGGDVEPTWSPDGRKLIFVKGRERHLYLFDFDTGAAAQRILDGGDADAQFGGAPAWSPDGRWVAFAADRGEGQGVGLWLMAPDGTGLRRLTRAPRPQAWMRDLRPAWSPDGKKLVFASNRHAATEDDAGDLDVYEVTIDGGEVVRLTRDPGVADDPCYSPDGKRVYFTSTRDAPRDWSIELFVMPAGGGEQRRLTRDEVPQNSSPSAGRIL